MNVLHENRGEGNISIGYYYLDIVSTNAISYHLLPQVSFFGSKILTIHTSNQTGLLLIRYISFAITISSVVLESQGTDIPYRIRNIMHKPWYWSILLIFLILIS